MLRYRSDWRVISNRESGSGYADIVIGIFAEKIGVVIEVKYANDGKLDAGCQKAMEQIEEIRYDEQVRLDGMEKVLKFGIACYGKGCRVIVKQG